MKTPETASHSLPRERKASPDLVVYFAAESADLSVEAQALLLKIIDTAKTSVVTLDGHSDDSGDGSYDMAVSDRRNAAVWRFMFMAGVPQNNIHRESFGAQRPAGDNATEAGRALNRRVELSLYPVAA
ncbi:OmpA family protein [Pseudomonas sp. HR96]|uniref:OmpA family protein n=1 Tax=Pseudomonas sp. HR96 TaxID=1027966 RepID=UPI002A76646B|nr:OmpA family protein [Pseudomonas sp. HR96]WPO99257.1 OmpA family protein [Pseudomonas sp. HR96]